MKPHFRLFSEKQFFNLPGHRGNDIAMTSESSFQLWRMNKLKVMPVMSLVLTVTFPKQNFLTCTCAKRINKYATSSVNFKVKLLGKKTRRQVFIEGFLSRKDGFPLKYIYSNQYFRH
ncbi:hypothetical protein J437_LFUL004806 [Ladona fulva]|uniref:Uncharacterized protein n=1 Tax=Ladona fulva TaxID=123851 RepID=A0A8K0P034_LADFU|nr:hypothetical protein J437_LFUL004806 [Ladona fulva]